MGSGKLLLFFLIIFLFATVSYSQTGNTKIGGAVRYNLFYKDYESETNANSTQFTWDTWRINVISESNGIKLDFEYRFYPTFDTHFIHHGFLGYSVNNDLNIKLGVIQVPFGISKFASNSWWFSTAYYIGLEDDYDIGISANWKYKSLIFDFAYFMQPEPAGPAPDDVSYGIGGSGRYSYDIIPVNGYHNHEKNQFNLRAVYKHTYSKNIKSATGISLQYGQLYNSIQNSSTDCFAFATHLNTDINQFNIKAEYIWYDYNAADDNGTEQSTVKMAAYGSGTYNVAARAQMIIAGLSYSLPVKLGPLHKITIYNDYTITIKDKDSFYDTHQNVTGFLLSAGNVYTYCDAAMGKNHPWLTDNFGKGLGEGMSDTKWNIRYNINIGYYF